MTYADFEQRRDATYDRMIANEKIVDSLPAKYEDMVVAEKNVRELLADAHRIHDRRVEFNERGERSDEQPEGLEVTRADGSVATDPSGNVITVAEEEQALAAKEAKRLEREQARADHAASRKR